MGGFARFGYHDCKCTMVHFEDESWAYDYCLICRTHSLCWAAWDAVKEDTLVVDHGQLLNCLCPRALVSEEGSRIDGLRVDKEHDKNHEMRHYQERDFVEPADREEATARFWADLERRYHYCIVCQRFTNECRNARCAPGAPKCTVEHTDVPLDDSYYICLAWEASQVQAPVPV